MLRNLLHLCSLVFFLTHPNVIHGGGWEPSDEPTRTRKDSLNAVGGDWCYQPNGDNSGCTENVGGWSKVKDYDCDKPTSKSQSPIDLDPNLKLSEHEIITLTNANKYAFPTFKMENNGHTIKSTPESHEASFTTKIGTFKLLELHLHWGPTDDSGSEHAFNGRSFSGELHLVHVNDKYATIPDVAASKDPTGLAVISILFQAVSEAGDCVLDVLKQHFEDNKATLSTISKDGVKITGSALTFEPILKEPGHLFHYVGSLTAPPCYEAVAWYVRREVLSCKPETVAAFRTFIKERNNPDYLKMNFRRLQFLNGRTVKLFKLN